MAIYENLKLPICPKCGNTKTVEEMNVLELYVHTSYEWYQCNHCHIKWHAKEGIREPDDNRPCFK